MRILLFGDISGIPQLLRHLPAEYVIGIVGASIRPQYHEPLSLITQGLDLPFIIQPKWQSETYEQFLKQIANLHPDLIWVNSYSMILRVDILAIPRLGGINIHGALLPQYRGCNPTQWAILNSETKTGVTLHEMTVGLDEGRIIDKRIVPLFFEDIWQSAHHRIAEATDDLIQENLPSILAGKWNAVPQEDASACYHHRRTPNDGIFRWDQPVVEIYNLIRALVSPLPGAFYYDSLKNQVILNRYLTPAEVTFLKYSMVGGGADGG